MKLFDEKKGLGIQIDYFYDKLAIAWYHSALIYLTGRFKEFSPKMQWEYETIGIEMIGDMANELRRLNGTEKFNYDLELCRMVMKGILLGLELRKKGLNFCQLCAVNGVLTNAARTEGEALLRPKWNSLYISWCEFMAKHFMTDPAPEEMATLQMIPNLIMAGFRGLARGMAANISEKWN